MEGSSFMTPLPFFSPSKPCSFSDPAPSSGVGGPPFISLPGNEGPVAPFVVRWAGAAVAGAGAEGCPLFLPAEWASVPTDMGPSGRGPRSPLHDRDEVMFTNHCWRFLA